MPGLRLDEYRQRCRATATTHNTGYIPAGFTRRAVELADCHDYLEAEKLKLSAEHFPLPCSLRKLVVERYGDPEHSDSGAQAMQLDELLDYLHAVEEYDTPLLQAVLNQTERMGDPALPNLEHLAVLRWLDATLAQWQRDYPLEDPLGRELQALMPVVAAIALTDHSFLTPGAHPLHRVLDDTHKTAIGWQPSLGRAGESLRQLVGKSVEQARAWFDHRDTDLTAICATFSVEAGRLRARTKRMIQRTVETEQGRIRSIQAKITAAAMINAALVKYRAPTDIGDFLKGPWYASAQLALLKFGHESEQWQSMCSTTDTLLDSLQTPDDNDQQRRQYLFEVVTQLPKSLKRWLLSLHHDSDAVADALALVELAHLRILRQQPLELHTIEPIVVEGTDNADIPPSAALSPMPQPGQWFSLDTGNGESLRVQLVLNIEQERRLLFANQAGIKPLQYSYQAFAELIENNAIIALDDGAGVSFSLCLANAAGITTTAALEQFAGTAAQQIQQEEERLQARREEDERREQQRLALEREEARQQEQQAAAERERWQQAEQQAQQQATGKFSSEDAPAETAGMDGLPDTHSSQGRPAEEFWLSYEHEPEEQTVQLDLPMGAWLGFHDGERPMLAKLAVYDREEDNYIFVNREGIKLRQLRRDELLELMSRDLIEVLKKGDSPRDAISRGIGETGDT